MIVHCLEGHIGDRVRLHHRRRRRVHQRPRPIDVVTVGVDQERVVSGHGDRLGAERLSILVAHRHGHLAVRDSIAAFREDLDDPIRGVRAVQRRRRRAFHDLDPFDVLGVDVREAEPRDRSIHDDQRARGIGRRAHLARGAAPGRGDRGGPPEPDRRLTAGRAAALNQPRPRHLALERAQRRDGRRLVQLARVHAAHREREVLSLGGPRRAGHHDLVERKWVELQLEVLRLGARGERDLLCAGLVPDVARPQRHGLSLGLVRRDGEGVGAGLGGPGGNAEPLDKDGSAPQRFAAPARDLTGDHRGLRLRVARHGAQQHEQRAGADA